MHQQAESVDKVRIKELLEDVSSVTDETKLKLSGILNTLRNRVIQTGSNTPEKLDSIIKIINNSGTPLDDSQFRDMVAHPPLNNIVAKVAGNNVYFIGQREQTNDVVKPSQQTDTLEKMAKKAVKTRI